MSAREKFLRLAPRWLAVAMTSQQAVEPEWKDYMGPEKAVEDFDLAPALSSKRKHASNAHLVMLDIDVPAALVPSSTPGNHHLYIDVKLSHEQYTKLVNVLEECGIIQPGIKMGFEARGGTTLRMPWVRKGYEMEDALNGGHLSAETLQWLLAQPDHVTPF